MAGNEREVPAQFDHAGQLAPVLAGLADRKDGCFIDGEHGRSLDPSAWQEQADARRRRAKRDVHRLTDVTTDTKLKTSAKHPDANPINGLLLAEDMTNRRPLVKEVATLF